MRAVAPASAARKASLRRPAQRSIVWTWKRRCSSRAALLLSLLMVSSIPYRPPKTLRLSRETMILSALFWGMLLLVAVRYRVSTSFVVLLGTYAVSGPIEAIFSRKKITLIDDQDLSLDELFGTEPADEVIER